MNKQDLIAKIVKDTGATKALVGKVLESAIDGISKTLKKGDTHHLRRVRHFQDVGPQGPHGPQPAHGRADQDRQAPGAALHGRQGPEGPGQVGAAPVLRQRIARARPGCSCGRGGGRLRLPSWPVRSVDSPTIRLLY